MAYDDQKEPALPVNGKSNRKSSDLLPRYFRTNANTKFLSATLDQVLKPGTAKKLNGYYGRKTATAYTPNDNYIGDVTKDRETYQLEPALISKDELGNVLFYKDYNDFKNQIKAFGGDISNESRLNSQEYYAWNPNLDWDKLTNFREYYWLPSGPASVSVFGQTNEVVSTYTVNSVDNLGNYGYVFNNNLTQNPTLELYRGQTYKFEVSAPGLPFTIRTSRQIESDNEYSIGITNSGVDEGTIEFTVPITAPDRLYYVSETDVNTGGTFRIADIGSNTSIDVEAEILGKKTYTSSTGLELLNGMKVKFEGTVTPEKYATGQWYVEGVGEQIKLILDTDLTIPQTYSADIEVEFDANNFDNLPYSTASSYSATKDYIIINRASPDKNAWTRSNRWFHRTVLEKTAEINGQIFNVDQSARAKRPIIEFNAGLKLHEFGTQAKKQNVDLIDTKTKDVFSTISGAEGYNIDGVDVTDGMRILFTADTDELVKNKIYKVEFIKHNSTVSQIALKDETDTNPVTNEVALIVKGTNAGKQYYFNGTTWNLAQYKSKVNQQPLFELFDDNGKSFLDSATYPVSDFAGNKIFSYSVGTGTNDTELGFPLKYRALENVGDITFDFDLVTKSFNYQIDNQPLSKTTDVGYCRQYTDLTTFTYCNGWTKAKSIKNPDALTLQKVVKQHDVLTPTNDFPIDVYDNSASITDLKVSVQVNSNWVWDWVLVDVNGVKTVRFAKAIPANSTVEVRTSCSKTKNANGFYEFPHTFENNPQNNNLSTFTLGEVNDHVYTMLDDIEGFSGAFPGKSNLGNLGDINVFGKKFLQYAGSANTSSYHITDKSANLVKAISYARKEYRKFKRSFLQVAENLGYDGPIKRHVDLILKEINKDKVNTNPFYFSDMIPYEAFKRLEFTVYDTQNNFFSLSNVFSLSSLSSKAVLIYQNGVQLIHNKDYTFNSDGFVIITATKARDDLIEIYEYESTDGSYVPATPSKLGLFPTYEPEIIDDNSYQTTTRIIKGHDGSKTVAFMDYRDQLLLELEKRIYNNIKSTYDVTRLDINDFIPSKDRDTGFTKLQINNSMMRDFIQWVESLGSLNYTDNKTFYDRANSFTWNYSGLSTRDGVALPGFWRAVYKFMFDTDTPHVTPWEMLGFYIKPTWWETQYGPAPYTSDNLVMWEDIQEGRIKEPNKSVVVNKKYKRKDLLRHLPVNASGQLLSPNDAGGIQGSVATTVDNVFKFGDEAPTETAWRRSSEYPFSLIKAWILNQPNKVIGLGLDTSRVKKSLSGQWIYTESGKALSPKDVVYPNITTDEKRVITCGLLNYTVDYLLSEATSDVATYKSQFSKVKNQLGIKLGSFTDKDKLRFILDSRTPFNEGNVFLPKENYQIFLNKSSPIDVISYSGVMIEKQSFGFVIRGYDLDNPVFSYNEVVQTATDPNLNVGGISESFLEWDSNKRYIVGKNVKHNNKFYRVKEDHTSTSEFDADKFAFMPELPLVGGATAIYRKTFLQTKTELPYGTVLFTIQDVVDFLLGYGNYLESIGFKFNYYNPETQTVEDWKLSTKEFLYFTTQNWSAGTVLSVSPAATKLEFDSSFSIVDDLYDNFYDYSIFNASGNKITESFTRLNRDSNTFELQLQTTADGLYHVKLPLVQYEHVAVLDNTSVFKDIIYDPEPGYRQERIKVLGYVASGWNGSLNIPGFVFDNAQITEWKQYTDYAIGDIVKYKEFYYTAENKIQGAELFQEKQWNRLESKPKAQLLTNFDYRINQFADFYDLDSDNFDSDQQKLAQHLIGYQKRQYLENIINDEVSQYKFYQGFIQDKGTRNAIDKLFDSLAAADKDSVDFYEEWAIKSAQYGASTGFEEIEYQLDEAKFKLTPQPFELVEVEPTAPTDLIYRIPHFSVFLKPEGYDTTRLPTKFLSNEYVKTVGYVTGEDVNRAVTTKDGILDFSTTELDKGAYIWVSTDQQSWNVLKHVDSEIIIKSIGQEATTITLNCNRTIDLVTGDIIGIYNIDTKLPGESAETAVEAFYKITNVYLNKIEINSSNADWEKLITLSNLNGIITKFKSQRVPTLSDAYDRNPQNEIIWVDDDDNGKWRVIKNSPVYSQAQTIKSTVTLDSTQHGFGNSIAVNASNTLMAVGVPNKGNGEVHLYSRGSDANNLIFQQVIKAPTGYVDTYDGSTEITSQKFGESVSFSPDGIYLIVGSPHASNVKTAFKGQFVPATDYNKNDIVKYGPNLWKAVAVIDGAVSAIPYTTFDSYAFIVANTDSTELNLLQTGNYKLPSKANTTHILVRAPKQAYEGSKQGDSIVLKWNNFSTINVQGDAVDVQPFDGAFAPITGTFLTDTHTIQAKVENVLHIANFQNLPGVGQTVNSAVASGTVAYVGDADGSAIVYVKDVNGTFATTGQLFIDNTITIGDYTEDYQNPTANVGGYWMITTPAYETTPDSTQLWIDPGHGLVYQDIIKQGSVRTPNYYYNIQDYIQSIGVQTTLNDQISFIETLTYEGDPNEIFAVQSSNLWTLRVPKAFSDTKTTGDKFYLYLDKESGETDLSTAALTYDIANKEHTIYDVWDGYIDFVFDNFSTINQLPFEPVVGNTVRDSSTGATAEITFYRRQFNNVRVYVKNVTGTWSAGDNYALTSDIIRQGVPDRTMGEIKAVSLGTSVVGKIFVMQESANFANAATTELLDKEYWIYDEITLQGIARTANVPSSNNNDWNQVNNITASNSANASASGLIKEGMISVYTVDANTNLYAHNNSYVIPERESYKRFGDEIDITQKDRLYRISVASGGDMTESNPGSIHFIKTGVDIDATTYDFQLDINPLFRGNFSATVFYKINEIVEYNNLLYSAKQNIASGSAFSPSDWTQLTTPTTHVGFLPSSQATQIAGEDIYSPQGGIRDFARSFDQDINGEVLVVSTLIQGNDSVGSRAINVYRQVNNQYSLSQTITAPYSDVSTDTLTGYADSIAISADGTLLAVGEPYNNTTDVRQGKVYIYKLTSGQFTLSQTLTSANNEQAEEFGTSLGFDGDVLAVTALQGDIEVETTFDVAIGETTYDNKFTKFKKSIMDSGVIYTYERINNTLVYAEEFIFDDQQSMMFGKNILVNKNHVYAGMPEMTDYNTYQGMIVDYRKTLGTTAWVNHRIPLDQVDLSDIKGAFLYNTKTNTLVSDIDVIDPVQGKIAGPAEQELSYKTYYDPASYNVGDTSVVVDTDNCWGNDNVGRLWWDLDAVKYYNYYQNDSIYQTNFWSKVFPGTSIAIYEWVESDVLPSEWDAQADTDLGIAQGISGVSRYGDTAYSQKLVWDPIARTSAQKYYFWVLNKKTTPNVDFRTMSAQAVQLLINDPAGQGYKFIALQAKDRFALFNVEQLMDDKDIALNIRYWTTENKDQNIHNEYQLISQGVANSKPNKDIELKWFDSLIGYDRQNRLVPDPLLSAKTKYGIANRPRQGIFVNKSEALKQVIERVNNVLEKNIIVDEFDISDLVKSDPAPSTSTRLYDAIIDTFEEVQFLGTANKKVPVLTPTIIDGVITQVLITDPGRGYIDPTYTSGVRKGPKITITGIGSDAEIECTLDELGKISTVTIVNGGEGYDSTTALTVRNFSALVLSDSNVSNKWSIYELIGTTWSRKVSQRYDTNMYWAYKDWYAENYNEFTEITDVVSASYLLSSLTNNIGDTVKIENIGSGGWLLLEKINNLTSDDYTVNYKTIGKQNATIYFKNTLYNVNISKIGFDSNNYDTIFYDSQPVTETRIILETIRDKIFVDNLEAEYNKLFLASVRYAFSEQPNIDWAFKTSFVKAQHNLGELEQKVTFKNDSLASYQSYINEVKPFKTKVREYVSSYGKLDLTNSISADFDLPPRYNELSKSIEASTAKITNNTIFGERDVTSFPDKHWFDNVGYEITEVNIGHAGSGYTLPPVIRFVGGGGTGATAKAYLSNGKLSKIAVINKGSGYTSAPLVEIDGSLRDTGVAGNATAILGNGVVRGTKVAFKFDRVSGNFYITTLKTTETFTGTGAQFVYNLKWPMDQRTTKTTVVVDGIELLKSEYSFGNFKDTTKSYDREIGRITFTTPPKLGKAISVTYHKSADLLNAQDRINLLYNPVTGMIGKDVSQLMDGIDYGGVEIKSFDFAGSAGWDTDPFFTETFDTYDNTYEDLVFQLDGSTSTLTWTTPLENGVVYNVYKNNVRIDDPYYNDSTIATNPNAKMVSLTGDGTTNSLNLQNLGIDANSEDTFIIRKTTSDGSFKPDATSYDTQLEGGTLLYDTAKGIDASEIVVDGDGFVTPLTSKGPEELIPGQILDTLDLKVFHRTVDGGSTIYSNVYWTDGSQTTFSMAGHPNSAEAVFVRLDNVKVSPTQYTIDYATNEITFGTAPSIRQLLSIIVMGEAGQKILDINTFTGDGSTIEFITNVEYQTGMTHFVNINGIAQNVTIFEAGSAYGADKGFTGIRFSTAPALNSVIDYGLFYASGTNFSQVATQEFTADGSTKTYTLATTPIGSNPVANQTIVKVNGSILNAGYSDKHTITGSILEYQLQSWQLGFNTIRGEDIEVYLDGVKLVRNIEYKWNSGTNTVEMTTGVATAGQILDIFLVMDGEYAFGYVGIEPGPDSSTKFIATPGVIYFDTAPALDAVVEVTTFSNHDIQDIERTKYNVISRTTISEGTVDYQEYTLLTNGIIKLRKAVQDTRYVWAIVNGVQLTPAVDYYVTEDKMHIKIVKTINSSDVVELIHFTAPPTLPKFGFRQFKDILNRTHYKRLDETNKYMLSKELTWSDLRIELTNGQNLPEPDKTSNLPGVIFIDGERIEYFVKKDNILRQIRRGTLGTGVKNSYPVGTEVIEQSINQTVPYKDELLTQVLTADGTSTAYELDFIPNNVNEFEVFVAGKRLRKNAISIFDPTTDQDSPEGDANSVAEFSVDGTTSTLTLVNTPAENQKIVIIRKQGKTWTDPGTSVTRAENDVARFLRAKVTELVK